MEDMRVVPANEIEEMLGRKLSDAEEQKVSMFCSIAYADRKRKDSCVA